jgi:hypothetical protein
MYKTALQVVDIFNAFLQNELVIYVSINEQLKCLQHFIYDFKYLLRKHDTVSRATCYRLL